MAKPIKYQQCQWCQRRLQRLTEFPNGGTSATWLPKEGRWVERIYTHPACWRVMQVAHQMYV